jgi:hypothetical protein
VTSLSPGAMGYKHTGTLYVKEIETEEDYKKAKSHLHSMAPIKDNEILTGLQKGRDHVSNTQNVTNTVKKVFGSVKNFFWRQ